MASITYPLEEAVDQNLEETIYKERDTEDDSKKDEIEDSEGNEAVAPIIDNLEEEAFRKLEEATINKKDNTEESFKEEEEIETVLEVSEGAESITPTTGNLDEGVIRNLEETLDKEETTKESFKKDNKVATVLEEFNCTKEITPTSSNLKDEAAENLEETSEIEEKTEESTGEDATDAKISDDIEGSVEVGSCAHKLEGNPIENLEEGLEREQNMENNSIEDIKEENMPNDIEDTEVSQIFENFEGTVLNLGETPKEEEKIEESYKEDDSVEKAPEDSNVTEEALTSNEDTLEENVVACEMIQTEEVTKQNIEEDVEKTKNTETISNNLEVQNLKKTPSKEEKTEQSFKEEDNVEKVNETVISNDDNWVGKAGENVDDNVEDMTTDLDEIEATTADNLEERIVPNFEENLEKEKNTEEDSQEDNKEPMTPKEEECEMIQTENVTEQNIEAAEAEKTEDTEASPVSINLEETAVQNLEEIIYKGKTQESSKEEDNVEKGPVGVYDETVTSNNDNLKGKVAETIDYSVENKTNDLEGTEDTPAGNLEESVVPDFNENLDSKKNIEEECEMIQIEDITEQNMEKSDAEKSEGIKAGQSADNLEEAAAQNVEETVDKEEKFKETSKEEDNGEKIAEESVVNEEFTSNDCNLDGEVVETLENEMEYMPEDSADTEATLTEITLVERAAPDFEECLNKANKIEEMSKEDNMALTNNEEDCETIQTEDITKSNTEEDNVEKTETTEASPIAENLKENSVQILEETPNEERIEESSKEEDDVEKTPDNPNVTEAITSDNENLEGKAVENLDDNVEYMIEATPASDKLEETIVSNFEENLVEEGNNEENSKEDAKMPTPKEEECEMIQREDIREQNIEDDNAAADNEILEDRSSKEVCEELETAVLCSSNTAEKSEQATEQDEDLIDDSVMQEVSEKDNKEEISGELDTKLNDSASAFIIVERDGTSYEEAELGEEIHEESSSLASQKVSFDVAETTGTVSEGLDTSVSVEMEKGCENVEYEKQDTIFEAQSDDLIEEDPCETMLKHSSEDEHKLAINETSETRDETSTEAQAPCESIEDPFTAQARDEIKIEEEDKTTDLINDSDSRSVDEAVGNKSGENLRVHPEPDTEQFLTNSEDMEISKREDAMEEYNLRESSGTKSFENEGSSNLGLENEKIEDGDKDIIEQQNFTEVVTEISDGIEVEKETVDGGGANSHGQEVANSIDDKTLAEVSNSADPAATTSCSSELVTGGIISEEILSQDEKNQNESDSTDMKCDEDDKEIKLEQNPNLEPEYNEQEQYTRETEKAVTWTEQVKEAVENADNKETIKEVIEGQSAVHEVHRVKDQDLLETTRDEPVGKGSEEEQIGGSEKSVEVFIAPPEESQGTVDQMTEQHQHDKIDTASTFETTTTADISLRETQADDLPSTETVAIQQGGLVHETRPVENSYIASDLPTTDLIQQTDEEAEASGQIYVSKNQGSEETVEETESQYAEKSNECEIKETEEASAIVPDHKSQDGEAVIEQEIKANPTLPTGIPEGELQPLSASEQQMQVIPQYREEENEAKQVEGPGDESQEVSSFGRTTEEACLQMEARDRKVSDFDLQPSKNNIKHIHEEEKETLDVAAEDKEVSEIVLKFESESIEAIQGDEITCDQAVEVQTLTSTSTFKIEEHETAADPTLPRRISEEQHQTSSNETTGTIENAEKKVNEVEILQRKSPENFATIKTTEESHAVLTESESENTDIDAMHPQAETADFKSKDDPCEKIIEATEIEQDKDLNYQLHKEIEIVDAEVKITEQVSLVEEVEKETETVSLTAERDGVAEAPIPRDEESVVNKSMDPTEASQVRRDVFQQEKTSQTEIEKPSLIQSQQNPSTEVISTTAELDSSLIKLSDLMEKSSRQLQATTTEHLPEEKQQRAGKEETHSEETLIEKEENEELPEASRDSSEVEVAAAAAAHKKEKSNNILSKVKHSISKVKKAITGKSNKPVSPK